MRLTFVVSTGRCGSTLVGNLLGRHPDVLSMSELSAILGSRGILDHPHLSADSLWRAMSTPDAAETVLMRSGLTIDEWCYPWLRESRFNQLTGVPPLLLYTYPPLTSDFHRLYDETQSALTGLTSGSTSTTLSSFISWLSEQFRAACPVERSGGSAKYVKKLLALYPDAKYVHLVRDGPECAASMARHHGFRMGVIQDRLEELLGYNPYHSAKQATSAGELPDDLAELTPDNFRVDTYRRYAIPTHVFGRRWSEQTVNVVRELLDMDSSQALTVRYERLVDDPAETICRIYEHIGVDPAIRHVGISGAMRSRGRGKSYARRRDAGRRAHLEEVCEPGRRAVDSVCPN